MLKAFPWHLHAVHVISIERPDICSRTYLRKAGFHYLMSLADQDEVWVHGSLPRFSRVCKGALKGRMSGRGRGERVCARAHPRAHARTSTRWYVCRFVCTYQCVCAGAHARAMQTQPSETNLPQVMREMGRQEPFERVFGGTFRKTPELEEACTQLAQDVLETMLLSR